MEMAMRLQGRMEMAMEKQNMAQGRNGGGMWGRIEMAMRCGAE
jgi:hypothetical protein